MFYGQIMMQGYLEDPAISFCAVGDETCDDAPLQVTDFGQGIQIDQLITKSYLEGGGGGGSQESYEISAYFYSRHCTLSNPTLPFYFITGDEHFYPNIKSKSIHDLMSFKPNEQSIDSKKIWQELCKKFNVFHLHKPYFQADEDKTILKQWIDAIGEHRVLIMETPKACIDVMLGAIALTSKKRTLEQYIEDMRDRGQTEGRVEEVSKALKVITNQFLEQNTVSFNVVNNILNNLRGGMEEEKKNDNEGQRKKIDAVKRQFGNEALEEEEEKIFKKTKALKGIFKNKIPNEFYCPITQDILIDPVMIEDGNTYERRAITLWFQQHDTSPITNLHLKSKNMMTNMALKKLIHDYIEQNQEVLNAMGLN